MCCRCNKKGSPEAEGLRAWLLLTDGVRWSFSTPLSLRGKERASGGILFSGLSEKGRFQPRFLSHMRKKASLTVEKKNSQGGFASEQTPHPSSCPPLAADRRRPFRCSSFSHTNRFAGFAWEPCPFAIPLKTTKEEAIPLPWNHHPSEYRRWRNSIRQIFNGRK